MLKYFRIWYRGNIRIQNSNFLPRGVINTGEQQIWAQITNLLKLDCVEELNHSRYRSEIYPRNRTFRVIIRKTGQKIFWSCHFNEHSNQKSANTKTVDVHDFSKIILHFWTCGAKLYEYFDDASDHWSVQIQINITGSGSGWIFIVFDGPESSWIRLIFASSGSGGIRSNFAGSGSYWIRIILPVLDLIGFE